MTEAQQQTEVLKIALVGNPNTGKSSLFNLLTGMRQRVGNFPGITVDKKEGSCTLPSGQELNIIDLPGLYSLQARSPDEEIVVGTLLDQHNSLYPDAVVYVADASNLKRNLFLFSQVADLGLPTLLVLTMADVAKGMGIATDVAALSVQLGVPVVAINPRHGAESDQIFAHIDTIFGAAQADKPRLSPPKGFYAPLPEAPDFRTFLAQPDGAARRSAIATDTIARYKKLDVLLSAVQQVGASARASITQKLDAIFLHPILGYAIFLGVLFLIFQAVFALASYPMDAIDASLTALGTWLSSTLPAGVLTRVLTEGLLPGIAGVLVFLPQIAILFGLLALLEDTGYMARVIFISDRIMRRFGLSGRSVVPLFSGLACAVPAIMAARTIENPKDRLLTILVTPFMSCSARLPVFTTLAALAVPPVQVLGIFSLQGIVLFGFYLLGIVFAVGSAWVLKHFVAARGQSFFVLELPLFKAPRWQNVGMEMYIKSRSFVVEAGKVILLISLVLWFLAAYGPGNGIEQARSTALAQATAQGLNSAEADNLAATQALQASYAGHMGRWLEPAIRPLGFDWRIGIALIASFAAREVFVGTMATIHSIGQNTDNPQLLIDRMAASRDAISGLPTYRPSVAFSLMIFYLLAMQCMSTVAIVRRETNSWFYAIAQLVGMTGLAYLCSWLVFVAME